VTAMAGGSSYTQLHRWARKNLTVHQVSRLAARVLTLFPGLADRYGVATGAITMAEAAERTLSVTEYREEYPLEGSAAAFLDGYAEALGPLWRDGVLALEARVSVLGVANAEVLMASGQLLKQPGAKLIEPEGGREIFKRQMATRHNSRLHVDGPMLSMVGSPRSAGHYFHFIAERFRYVLHALRECPELRGATLLVREKVGPHQEAAYAYLQRAYPMLKLRTVADDVRVSCGELVTSGRRHAHPVCHFAGAADLDEVARAFRTIYGIGKPAGTRRIYISRSGTRLRRTTNEAEVAAVLEARGFETVRPETLSHADQVRLFGEAAVVVGTGGAALTNLIFAPRGAVVVETCPPEVQFPYFIGLALARGMRYAHVYGGKAGPNESYALDPARLAAAVDGALALR